MDAWSVGRRGEAARAYTPTMATTHVELDRQRIKELTEREEQRLNEQTTASQRMYERASKVLDYRTTRTIEDGISEILDALRAGAVDPDDRRWYTLRQYQFLAEVERTWNDVAMDDRVLS